VPGSLRDGILSLAADPVRLEAWREPARARATEFSYEAAANAFWNFYVEVLKGKRVEGGG
jgi:hypothetical protein